MRPIGTSLEYCLESRADRDDDAGACHHGRVTLGDNTTPTLTGAFTVVRIRAKTTHRHTHTHTNINILPIYFIARNFPTKLIKHNHIDSHIAA